MLISGNARSAAWVDRIVLRYSCITNEPENWNFIRGPSCIRNLEKEPQHRGYEPLVKKTSLPGMVFEYWIQ